MALVAEAREHSARALAELRAPVRGINPPVLAERGLGDAIRALALDCPVPTTADIGLAGRFPAPVEAAAYFAVAEVLTNVAKHADARSVHIRAEHALMAEGRSSRAIAQRLFVTEKAVTKHSTSIFAKLGLPPSEDDNRRVLAVLAYLSA